MRPEDEFFCVIHPLAMFFALLLKIPYNYAVLGGFMLSFWDVVVILTFVYYTVITAVGFRVWMYMQTQAQTPADPCPGPAVIVDP